MAATSSGADEQQSGQLVAAGDSSAESVQVFVRIRRIVGNREQNTALVAHQTGDKVLTFPISSSPPNPPLQATTHTQSADPRPNTHDTRTHNRVYTLKTMHTM